MFLQFQDFSPVSCEPWEPKGSMEPTLGNLRRNPVPAPKRMQALNLCTLRLVTENKVKQRVEQRQEIACVEGLRAAVLSEESEHAELVSNTRLSQWSRSAPIIQSQVSHLSLEGQKSLRSGLWCTEWDVEGSRCIDSTLRWNISSV